MAQRSRRDHLRYMESIHNTLPGVLCILFSQPIPSGSSFLRPTSVRRPSSCDNSASVSLDFLRGSDIEMRVLEEHVLKVRG